jgi:hypothetical protein
MEEKQLNNKSKTNIELFLEMYADRINGDPNFEKFITDDRSEDLLKHHTFKDAKKDPLFGQLINDPDYINISLIEVDPDGFNETLDLEALIRDFYGTLRFADLKQKFESFVFTCYPGGEQCLIEQPGPDEIDELMQFIDIVTQKVRAVPFGNRLVSESWLSGDDEIRKDKKLYHQIGMSGFQIVNVAFAHIKKN